MKQLGLAMHNYESTHGCLPSAAVCSADGTPLLSWRVLILPFIEQESLFKRFRLDESWDSPHNLPLLKEMPVAYTLYRDYVTEEPHTTFYQVFIGKGTPFDGSRPLNLDEVSAKDGTAYTFLIVEAGKAVPWTKPTDLPYAADQPVPPLGGMFKDGFRVAFMDGSVLTIKHGIREDALRAAITWNGGERLDPDLFK